MKWGERRRGAAFCMSTCLSEEGIREDTALPGVAPVSIGSLTLASENKSSRVCL